MKRALAFITLVSVLALAGPALAQAGYTFVPVYSITGTVSPHASAAADGDDIVFFRTLDEYNNSGFYVIDKVGPDGTAGVSNRYLLNATNHPAFWGLKTGDTFKVATVQDANGYGAGPADVTISGTGYEVVNMAIVYGGGVGEPPEISYAQAPTIEQIKFNDRTYYKHLVEAEEEKDRVPFYTSSTPTIKATIKGTEAFGVDTASITIKINDREPYQMLAANISETARVADLVSSLSISFGVPESDPLPSDPAQDVESTIAFTAWDHGKSVSTTEVCRVIVAGGPLRLLDTPLPYPSPFAPSRQKTEIQYTLSQDANIDIVIISIAGEAVKRVRCAAGSEGGKAGINKVEWNGRNMIGEQVGNGVYVGTIIARDQNKLLGKFKVTVFD